MWNEHRHKLDDSNVLLPPQALNHETGSEALPPSYEETIDLEKALHIHPFRGYPSDDVSSSRLPAIPSDPLLPKLRIAQEPLCQPSSRSTRVIRTLRYTIFTVYRRLFTLVFLLNGIGVFVLVRQGAQHASEILRLSTLASLASGNFLLAILVRQDYLVNLLFRTAWLVPWFVPLRVRRLAARVYCYGGIHSGAAVMGTLWWVLFTVEISRIFARAGDYTFPVLVLTWGILLLLVSILLLASPKLRAKHHDTFEITHRFMGWTSIALFWAQLLLLTHHTSMDIAHKKHFGTLLLHHPTFWNLTLITLLLIYPWLRLRRWTFTAHTLSSHALRLSFPDNIHKFSCLSISSSPLREWHPFATFPCASPNSPDSQGSSMVISDAGDWTRHLIQHTQLQTTRQLAMLQNATGREKGTEDTVTLRFWVKSHPKAGVLSLSCLFPRVIILTTGSGIGPALSSLLDRPATQVARLIWSTRTPLLTYGEKMLELVEQADPEALVIDTSELGRPDLLDVAWRMYRDIQAEAVFVLSNEKVTRMVVGGLEKRGVPAFGPIWDS